MDAHRGYRIRLQIAGSSMHNNTMSPRCRPEADGSEHHARTARMVRVVLRDLHTRWKAWKVLAMSPYFFLFAASHRAHWEAGWHQSVAKSPPPDDRPLASKNKRIISSSQSSESFFRASPFSPLPVTHWLFSRLFIGNVFPPGRRRSASTTVALKSLPQKSHRPTNPPALYPLRHLLHEP